MSMTKKSQIKNIFIQFIIMDFIIGNYKFKVKNKNISIGNQLN